jgi:SAM-dependent methyltransferase
VKPFEKFTQRLPRPLVRSVRDSYLFVLDLKDSIQGRRDDLVPPRSLHYVGGGDFRRIGQQHLNQFIDLCTLRPDETVLDIGCGTGRMAVPLLSYLNESGSYTGFDIAPKAIRWCQRHISVRNPRFSFVFADIYNKEYNPRGRSSAAEYRFPCDTAAVDFAFATSVFTHMRTAEVKRYLTELRRVMAPSGRAMLSFFILDEFNRRLVREGRASFRFDTALDGCFTVDPRTPERAIAYTEASLMALFAEAGLEIRPPIAYGSWSGRAGVLDAQDIVIATVS